jgi:hypothetical protein
MRFRDLLWPQGVSGNVELAASDAGNIAENHAVPTDLTPAELTKADVKGDPASAIPLPPAVQSGLTGMLALALAGLYRPIRRALRP